jgi:hypothetical protein
LSRSSPVTSRCWSAPSGGICSRRDSRPSQSPAPARATAMSSRAAGWCRSRLDPTRSPPKGGLWIAGTTRPPALTENTQLDQPGPALEFPARGRGRDKRIPPASRPAPLSTFLRGRRRDRARNPRL